MVILPMSCSGCCVDSHRMAVPCDTFTHIISQIMNMEDLFPTDTQRLPVAVKVLICVIILGHILWKILITRWHYLLVYLVEWWLWKWAIPLKCRSILNQRNSNLKIKIRGAVASREQPSSIFSVVDCRCCWFYLSRVTTLLYRILFLMDMLCFNHGLLDVWKTWPSGLRSSQNTLVSP